MGRANISIAITSNFNSRGIDAAIKKAEQLSVAYVHAKGQFGKAAVDLGASMGMAGARLAAMGKSVAEIGDRLTMGLTVPMGIAAGAAIMAAAKIDTAWYNVRKTVDMTEEGYENLKRSAMELAETQPVDTETILNIEALGGQLGITNGYLEDFARVVSGLDISTNMDSSTAAQELAQFRNIVQMSEDDLDNWASTVVDLGNHTATTEADMVNLAMRFASAGHIAGMSNADILGLSAALSGLGMRAEAGGSAISRTINDINNSVATGGENLQKWADLVGKTPEQFSEAWRAAPMDEFLDVLQNINSAGSDMGAVLEELGITQIRQSDAMRRLASSGEYVSETVERANQAWEQNSALTQEVERRNESLQARWDTFCNSIVNDAARIGEPLADVGLDFLEGLRPAIQGIGDLATAFADADPAVQRFAFNLGAVALAAGPVLSITGRLMQAVGNMGVRVGRVVQQYGVYREALESTDVAMVRNLSEQRNLSTQLGLSRNEWVRASGGIDQWKRNIQAATTVVEENARSSTVNRAAVSAYADALGVGADSQARFTGGVRSSLGAVQFATGAQERYRNALANGARSATEAAQIALQYGDNTADAAVAANRAANEALGYGGALSSEARSGTDAARAALRVADSRRVQREATANAKDAVQHMTRAEADAAVQTRRGQQELQRLNETAERGPSCFGRFGDALKGALIGFGAMAAIGAIVAGITWLVSQMEEAAERADNLDRATNGLRDALYGAGDAAEDASGMHRDFIASLGETHQHVKDAIENQAELADKYKEIDKNAAASIGSIDRARDAIDRYMNVSGLTASEQYRLKSAVDAYNEACGTQISVVDAANGKIADETGAILENKDAILQNIDARRRQLELEAVESKYEATYQAMYDTQMAHAEAVDRLNKAKARLAELNDKESLTWDEAMERYALITGEMDKLQQDVDETGASLDEASGALERISGQMDALAGSASLAGSGLEALLDPASKFAAAFAVIPDCTHDINEFAAACQTAGINFDALNSLSQEDLQLIANNFDGTTRSIIESLEELGRTDVLDNLGENWKNEMGQATADLAQGIANTRGIAVAELAALADDLGIKGEEATRRFLNGLRDGLDAGLNLDQAAKLAQRIAESFDEDLTPDQAKDIARRFLEGLAAGMGETGAIEQAILGFKNSLKQSMAGIDLSEEGGHAMQTWLASFNLGGGSGQINLDPLRQNLNTELDTIHNTVNEKGEVTGEDVPLKITEGMNGNAGAVEGAGANIIALLMSALFGGVGQAAGVGSDTGQGYGDAVAAQGHVAEAAAVNTLGKLLIVWLLGIASAQKAGERTGTGYAQSLAQSSQKAVTAAQAISIATGTAFGAGRSQAAAAGNSLGAAFASAVWTSGGQAIAYARSIRSSVKSIFDDMPTANVRVNVTRTVSTAPASFGGHAVQYASLPSQTPIAPVPTMGTEMAATVAQTAVQRASAAREVPASQAAQAVAATVRAVAQSAPSVDYDTLYRVTESAVASGIRKAGGISPVVELDGRVVSRQLASHMDRELGRLDRMRG